MPDGLDFEQPLLELELRIAALQATDDPAHADEVARLQDRLERQRQRTYAALTPWQRTQLARHPKRPHTRDWCKLLLEDFTELHGDRLFRDDPAIVGGLARFEGQSLVVIGHQKGRDTREKIARNFGMPHPEGYRKALRLMELAAKFGKPIVTFIDTPGAYPGLGAEERGQAEAIARNLRRMASLPTPMIAVVTGEGGSGGALAIGMGNRVLMLEHAVYSVISPEGCAAILWGDAGKAPEAAEAMRTTAPELLRLGVIDGIVPEPVGGAHRDWEGAAASLRAAQRVHLGLAAGGGHDVAVVAPGERLQPVALHGQEPPRERAQLGPVHHAALGVEGLVVDLAHDPELSQPLDAHAVGLGQRAKPRRLLGDHADADQRDVHVLGGVVDRAHLGVAQQAPALALDRLEREQVLDGQGVGAHVRPVLGGHHADERVGEDVDELERALAGQRIERQVAEAALAQRVDRVAEREPARQPEPHAVLGDPLEVV